MKKLTINSEFINKFEPCISGIDNVNKHYPHWSGSLLDVMNK